MFNFKNINYDSLYSDKAKKYKDDSYVRSKCYFYYKKYLEDGHYVINTYDKCLYELDKTMKNEDFVGYFVAKSNMIERCIKVAEGNDKVIGIISGNPIQKMLFVDKNDEEVFLSDKFNRFLMNKSINRNFEFKEVPLNEYYDDIEYEDYIDENGNIKSKEIIVKRPKMEHVKVYDNVYKAFVSTTTNKKFDYNSVHRKIIKTHHEISTLCVLRDDGTCKPDCYVKHNGHGIGTISYSEDNKDIIMLWRIDDNTIVVELS